jgi:hypothetical protein
MVSQSSGIRAIEILVIPYLLQIDFLCAWLLSFANRSVAMQSILSTGLSDHEKPQLCTPRRWYRCYNRQRSSLARHWRRKKERPPARTAGETPAINAAPAALIFPKCYGRQAWNDRPRSWSRAGGVCRSSASAPSSSATSRRRTVRRPRRRRRSGSISRQSSASDWCCRSIARLSDRASPRRLARDHRRAAFG